MEQEAIALWAYTGDQKQSRDTAWTHSDTQTLNYCKHLIFFDPKKLLL